MRFVLSALMVIAITKERYSVKRWTTVVCKEGDKYHTVLNDDWFLAQSVFGFAVFIDSVINWNSQWMATVDETRYTRRANIRGLLLNVALLSWAFCWYHFHYRLHHVHCAWDTLKEQHPRIYYVQWGLFFTYLAGDAFVVLMLFGVFIRMSQMIGELACGDAPGSDLLD